MVYGSLKISVFHFQKLVNQMMRGLARALISIRL